MWDRKYGVDTFNGRLLSRYRSSSLLILWPKGSTSVGLSTEYISIILDTRPTKSS